MSMYIPLKVGEAATILDPATGGPVTVIVTAAEDGQSTIRVVAPSDVRGIVGQAALSGGEPGLPRLSCASFQVRGLNRPGGIEP